MFRPSHTSPQLFAAVIAALVTCTVAGCSGGGDGDSEAHGGSGASGSASSCRTGTPGGTYAQSCSSCSMIDTILMCQCDTGNGYSASAKLDTCSCKSADSSNAIYNSGGSLFCGQ